MTHYAPAPSDSTLCGRSSRCSSECWVFVLDRTIDCDHCLSLLDPESLLLVHRLRLRPIWVPPQPAPPSAEEIEFYNLEKRRRHWHQVRADLLAGADAVSPEPKPPRWLARVTLALRCLLSL